MRIGFIGSGGTGKTATIQELLKIMPGLEYMPSIVRGVFAEYGLTEDSFSALPDHRRMEIQVELFRRKADEDKLWEKRSYVADRTLADHFTYTLYRSPNLLSSQVISGMTELVKQNLDSYDHLFLFTRDAFCAVNDGFRDLRPAYQETIDLMMRGVIDRFAPFRAIKVPSGTPAARARYVKFQIEDAIKATSAASGL